MNNPNNMVVTTAGMNLEGKITLTVTHISRPRLAGSESDCKCNASGSDSESDFNYYCFPFVHFSYHFTI